MTPHSLESNIIFLCGEFSHVFHRALTTEFKKCRIPVTVEQFSILALLYYKNGINQQEISAVLNRDKTTVARVVSVMVKNKLVSRAMDKSDNRGKLIHLTTRGKAVQRKAVTASGKLYELAIDGIEPAGLKTGLRVMTQLMANVKTRTI